MKAHWAILPSALLLGACFVYGEDLLESAESTSSTSSSGGSGGESGGAGGETSSVSGMGGAPATVGSGGDGGMMASSSSASSSVSSSASTNVSSSSVASSSSTGIVMTEVVWLNEIHYDNENADVAEGFEVAGTAGTNLGLYSVELYNGSNGQTYNTIGLTGSLTNQQAGYGTKWFPLPFDAFQNGAPDGLALVRSGVLVQFLSYEGTITATNGAAIGTTSVNIGVLETAGTPVGQSLQLTGTGNAYAEFTWSGPVTATPNALNVGQTFN